MPRPTFGVRADATVWPRAAPPAVVLAAAIVAWCATGTNVADVVLFLAHELAFVLLPGCLLYAALRSRRPSALELGAMGYALGSVLEVMAFALTAALHVRGALWAYPPLAAASALAALRARRPRTERGGGAGEGCASADTAAGWLLALVCVVAIAYVVVAYFLFAPLPSHARSVVYIPDLVFHLGVAGEALHHWPIADPKVAGVALPYEWFVYIKLAATSQITHIPLPTVLFRLYILPLLVSLIALLALAGRMVSGGRRIGIAAAALFVFVGQLGLDPDDQLVFANTVFFSLYDSPSYLCGLVLFLAALILLLELLRGSRGTVGDWLVLTLVLLGCAVAKATILPVVLGGLLLYLAWRRAAGWSRGDGAAARALLTAAAVFVITYLVIYRAESGGLHLRPPGSLRTMSIVADLEQPLAGAIGHPAFWLLAAVGGVIGFCGATLAGLPHGLSVVRIRRAPSSMFLLGLLVASFVPFLLLAHIGNSQNFFTYYGLCAACILSAQGLAVAWERTRPSPRAMRLLVLCAAIWLAVLLAAAILPGVLHHPASLHKRYALWVGLPLAGVAVLLIAARRARARRSLLQFAAVVAVLLVGALDTPLHTGRYVVAALRSRATLYVQDSPEGRGLTPGLQRALEWVRGNVPTDAVIAVNNQFSQAAEQSPDYYYYSAFGERRVFLEGWLDTIPTASLSDPRTMPFPQRLRLNKALFENADARALGTMERQFGVRYLLVDLVHGPVNPRLATLARLRFSDPQALVYQVTPT